MAVLKAEKREGVGKYVAFDMRKEGMIPAVYYGKGVENINLSVNEKELGILVKSGERIVDLDIAGETKKAILKAVQHETIGDGLLHADFRAIDENTALHVEVAVELVGEAKGTKLGGVVEQDLHMVGVECIPAKLPEFIKVDVTELDMNAVWYVKDLPAIDGVTYTTQEDVAVVSCHGKAEVEEEEESEESEEA